MHGRPGPVIFSWETELHTETSGLDSCAKQRCAQLSGSEAAR